MAEDETPEQQKAEEAASAGSNDSPDMRSSKTFTPDKKPKLLRWLVIFIIILVLILAGLFGWLWWRDRNSDSGEESSSSSMTEPPEAEEPGTVCADDFTVYANEDLGVEFCYPTAWGDVAATDAKFAAADTGERWLLSFGDKDAVHAGLVSEDWSTEVPRDGTCVDPAIQVLPEFTPFSTDWSVETTEGDPPQPASATRGIEAVEDQYLIREYVDNLLTNGACLTGYAIIDNPTYPFVIASYFAEFTGAVTTPQLHMDGPNVLISEADRDDFTVFVASIKAIEE